MNPPPNSHSQPEFFYDSPKNRLSVSLFFIYFGQDLLPELDAGIFLDTDIVLFDDPALLWDRCALVIISLFVDLVQVDC